MFGWSNLFLLLVRVHIAQGLASRSEGSLSNISDLITEGLSPATIKKESLAQVFSCEYCEISKNNFLHRTPRVAASLII